MGEILDFARVCHVVKTMCVKSDFSFRFQSVISGN